MALGWTAASVAKTAPDKYTVKVPGGLAFAEFRGYEDWAVVGISQNGGHFAAILANPAMINAYRDGVPENGKPFPDGARMAKIHWTPKTVDTQPGKPVVPGALENVDFMVKDSKRFADSAGWGWAAFEYDTSTGAFSPATGANKPPQANDARCGLACHTLAKTHDYVFTAYGKR